MPRLNLLDKSLSFYGDDYEYDECEVYRKDWFDGIGIIDECNLPYRESMRDELRRNRECWTRWRIGPKVESATIWQFRDRILEHNLGKSHDLAFSYYVKKTKHISRNIYYWFQPFENRYIGLENYTVDSEGNIQKGAWRLNREKARFVRGTKPMNFKSADYQEAYVHKDTGVIKSNTYYDKESNWELKIISGYNVPNIYYNSKKYRKLRYEYNQKHRQLERQRKAAAKAKSYSFLTREEEHIKKSKLEDGWKIESYGFDSESFRGEGYHGRKNKKK